MAAGEEGARVGLSRNCYRWRNLDCSDSIGCFSCLIFLNHWLSADWARSVFSSNIARDSNAFCARFSMEDLTLSSVCGVCLRNVSIICWWFNFDAFGCAIGRLKASAYFVYRYWGEEFRGMFALLIEVIGAYENMTAMLAMAATSWNGGIGGLSDIGARTGTAEAIVCAPAV